MKKISIISIAVILIFIAFLSIEDTSSMDILNLDPETVASISVIRAGREGALLDRTAAPVDPAEDIAYLIEQLNQIEVRKAGKAGTVFDYTMTIYIGYGPDYADTYIEDGWNPIRISGNSICYDGIAYEVVSGDLQAVTARLDELISSGKYS